MYGSIWSWVQILSLLTHPRKVLNTIKYDSEGLSFQLTTSGEKKQSNHRSYLVRGTAIISHAFSNELSTLKASLRDRKQHHFTVLEWHFAPAKALSVEGLDSISYLVCRAQCKMKTRDSWFRSYEDVSEDGGHSLSQSQGPSNHGVLGCTGHTSTRLLR